MKRLKVCNFLKGNWLIFNIYQKYGTSTDLATLIPVPTHDFLKQHIVDIELKYWKYYYKNLIHQNFSKCMVPPYIKIKIELGELRQDIQYN
jgi:hypothetical protein